MRSIRLDETGSLAQLRPMEKIRHCIIRCLYFLVISLFAGLLANAVSGFDMMVHPVRYTIAHLLFALVFVVTGDLLFFRKKN